LNLIMDIRIGDVQRLIDYSYYSPLAIENWENTQSLLMTCLLSVKSQYLIHLDYYYAIFDDDMCIDVLFSEDKYVQ